MGMVIAVVLTSVAIILLINLAISVVNCLSFNYDNLISYSYSHIVKLKWSQIKKFYPINPDRWKYEEIFETGYHTILTDFKVLLYKTDKETIRIQLSLIDYLHFKFCKRYCHKDNNAIGEKLLLESVQKDIDLLKKQSNHLIAQSAKRIEEMVREREKRHE